MRSSAGRRTACSRSISRNPVTLPMLHLGGGLDMRRDSDINWRRVDGFDAFYAQYALVFVREDLDEAGLSFAPMLEDPRCARASGEVAMAFEQTANLSDV